MPAIELTVPPVDEEAVDLEQRRNIDHLVLPTRDLAVARRRLTQLGFTVAPEAEHPFGTRNACVYLGDGSYLEMLTVGDPKVVRQAIRDSNVFVARDDAFRYRRGQEGFSAVAFASADAAEDHARYGRYGYSAGPMLDFSRDFVDAQGRKDQASFRLAFASDVRAPDCLFFACERVRVPEVDRTALQGHPNGVSKLNAVILTAPLAFDFAQMVLLLCGGRIDHNGPFGKEPSLMAGNARFEFLDDDDFAKRYGAPANGDRGLEARAVVFHVSSIETVKKILRSNDVDCFAYEGRLIVQAAPGQGALFMFEEFYGGSS